MKYLENYSVYGELKVVCDTSCFSIVSSYVNNLGTKSVIYDREGNSSVISTIKTLISKGIGSIVVILDDRGELKNKMEERVSFLREFIGERDCKKLDIKMASEI